MKNKKPLIKLGAGKGNLLGVTNKYLESLGLEPIEKGRRLIHYRETDKYILEIVLLRWEDIKEYRSEFDMIIFGADQWLESGHKSMIALEYFEQENCRLSLLVPKEKADMPLKYFTERKIATGYKRLLKEYTGISDDRNIVKLSGSVEVAPCLGWADSIFDVVESGETAKEHGLVEYKVFVKFGAMLATTKPEMIPFLSSLGLIRSLGIGRTIAFDGVDGSGKSALARHFVQCGLGNGRPTVLVCPYSGNIGTNAKSMLDAGYIHEWACSIGFNHWRPPVEVNEVYDRTVLTFITEYIKNGLSDGEIRRALEKWGRLPDTVFLCRADLDTLKARVGKRDDRDEYDEDDALAEYMKLYDMAAEIAEKLGINVIRTDTNSSLNDTIAFVSEHIGLMDGQK